MSTVLRNSLLATLLIVLCALVGATVTAPRDAPVLSLPVRHGPPNASNRPDENRALSLDGSAWQGLPDPSCALHTLSFRALSFAPSPRALRPPRTQVCGLDPPHFSHPGALLGTGNTSHRQLHHPAVSLSICQVPNINSTITLRDHVDVDIIHVMVTRVPRSSGLSSLSHSGAAHRACSDADLFRCATPSQVALCDTCDVDSHRRVADVRIHRPRPRVCFPLARQLNQHHQLDDVMHSAPSISLEHACARGSSFAVLSVRPWQPGSQAFVQSSARQPCSLSAQLGRCSGRSIGVAVGDFALAVRAARRSQTMGAPPQ